MSLIPAARHPLGAVALLTTLLSGAAAAEPRIALVIASGQVAAHDIAPVPACPPSARAVGRQLTALGFAVVESIDQTRGETGAAIADLARRLRGTTDARVVVYACGPVAELNGRAFVLPASALLERSSDVLTQGVLLRSLLDTLVEARPGAALLALDAFADPPGLPALPAPPGDATVGVIASSQAGRQGQRTALAAALLGELVEPTATGTDLGTLLTRLQARLDQMPEPPQHREEPPGTSAALLPAAAPAPVPAETAPPVAEAVAPAEPTPPAADALPPGDTPAPSEAAPPGDTAAPPPPVAESRSPPEPAAVTSPSAPAPVPAPPIETPVPPAPPAESRPEPAPAPAAIAPPSAPTPAPAAPAAAPVPAPPPVTDAVRLSEADRRAIQSSLAALGYYADRIDGNFGPGTRTAIRRYQREIGEAMTGALTADQARRLIAGAASRRR